MGEFDALSNNQIIMLMKEMEQEHEAVKVRLENVYNEMLAVEKRYAEAGKAIHDRLNPHAGVKINKD